VSASIRPDRLRDGLPLLIARKVLGWCKRCKLAHAFLWEYGYKRLKLAQLLGQLGVFLTCRPFPAAGDGAETTAPRASRLISRA
jgi:hypothetical protein